MDKKALYQLSYGVFMLSTKTADKANGCITNTCIQVANSPERVAISVLNTNYTCDLIKESGIFTVSLLDETCTFETIKHFGFQSGRNVNKFESMTLPEDINGVPYLGWQTCAVISCKVVESYELGSHTLFIAEIQDAKRLNDHAPLTYADYQNRVKPKPQQVKNDREIVGWRCKICKYVYEGSELPADFTCPLCGHDKDDFEPIYKD
ncbi:MAG: flavin reductase [Eubacteriales bacterium]|nr:flavin reductase [Eubacteriales bacterium]